MEGMEILVLGDGAYVFAVLNAVASITHYNLLGAIGAVVGIILMAIKGVSAQGGPSLNPASFLISVVLFWIIFIPRADRVVVTEIMVQPGNVTPRSFVVDNVPYGLAAAGFMMSQLGAQMTQIYETNFGSAEDSQRGTTGGLGRNLAMLTMVQTMIADPRFTDSQKDPTKPGYIARARGNFIRQIQKCVVPNLNHGRLSIAAVMNAPGIEGTINPVTANRAINLEYQKADGSYETINCAEAGQRVLGDVTSPQMEQAFDAAMKQRGKAGNSLEIQNAFGQFTNNMAIKVSDLVAIQMQTSVLMEARTRGSLSPADAQAVIMIEEAARKRNVQWAGEENLFVRILRPIVGFFEALFYALAPIIAFVVTMGPFGWGLVGKYAMLTVWVGLWFPMLAITQLYSNIKMKEFFRLISDENSFGNAQYSPEQLHQISLQSMDALGTASALAAATPALAMSLLYGGAVSMSYLAGRLQGSDMIDEKKVSPDASTVNSIAAIGPTTMGSTGAGNVTNGRSIPSLSISDAASEASAYKQAFAETKQVQFADAFSKTLQRSSNATETAEKLVSAGWGETDSKTFGNLTEKSVGEHAGTAEEKALAQQILQSRQAAITGSVYAGVGGSTPIVSGGAEVRASVGGSTASSDTFNNAVKIAQAVERGWRQSEDARQQLGSIVQHAVSNASKEAYSEMVGETDARALTRTASEAVSAQQAAEATANITSQFGGQQSLFYNDLAQRYWEDHGGADAANARLMQQVQDAGLMNEYENRLPAMQASGLGADRQAAQFAAMAETLRAGAMGQQGGTVAEAAFTEITDSAFGVGANNGLGAADRVHAGEAFGNRIESETNGVNARATAGGVSGPGFGAGAVRGQVAAGSAAVGGDIAETTTSVRTTPAQLGTTAEQSSIRASGEGAVDGFAKHHTRNINDQGNQAVGEAAQTLAGMEIPDSPKAN